MASKPKIFQTPEVAKLLRASRYMLNRLMLRCGIETSYGSRGVRGSRLLFTVQDVATAAIAYWCFRGGLRTRAIRGVLADKEVKALVGQLANPEAIEAKGERIKFLVSWRVATSSKEARQEVALEEDSAGIQQTMEESHQFGFLVMPIGRLLKELAERVRRF